MDSSPLRRLARAHADGRLDFSDYRKRRREFLDAVEAGLPPRAWNEWDHGSDQPDSEPTWQGQVASLHAQEKPGPTRPRINTRLVGAVAIVAGILFVWLFTTERHSRDSGSPRQAPVQSNTLQSTSTRTGQASLAAASAGKTAPGLEPGLETDEDGDPMKSEPDVIPDSAEVPGKAVVDVTPDDARASFALSDGTTPPTAEGRTGALRTDHGWLLTQPTHHYTVHLFASASHQHAREFRDRLGDIETRVIVTPSSSTPFRVISGSYAGEQAAFDAFLQLPSAFQHGFGKPEIVRMDDLQALVRFGNAQPPSSRHSAPVPTN